MKKIQKKIERGFTLIELLAVIVILAIILVIAVPQIFKTIDESKVSSYNSQIELIKRTTDIYRTQYMNEITNPNDVKISVDTLIEKGLLKNIINPVTKRSFETGMNIRMITDANSTNYEIYEGPELVTGMIPVYFDEVSNVWKKADKSNLNNTWYDYNNYKWANAVTVTSATRTTHNNATVGATIPMTDINTMFVWIPRFKYRIPAGTGPREIEVMCETKYTDKSNGDAVTSYYTHPAFTFGNEELNGMWVGKFETTGTIDSPTIKPGELSLRNQTLKAMFNGVKANMQASGTYGFTNESDAHMMKNMEWGAVTYLYFSKYGKYGNSNYTGLDNELYLNNSSSYYTGRSMGTYSGNGIDTSLDNPPSLYEFAPNGYYTYEGFCATIHASLPAPCNSGNIGQVLTNKTLAYGASTSGTVYGIYDMSGGTWEYVMGMYMPNPIPLTGIRDRSGFSSTIVDSQYNLLSIETKYYDRYLTNVIVTAGILGDATKEVYNWYGDYNYYASPLWPWLTRGGRSWDDTSSGAFSFIDDSGNSYIDNALRIVITP